MLEQDAGVNYISVVPFCRVLLSLKIDFFFPLFLWDRDGVRRILQWGLLLPMFTSARGDTVHVGLIRLVPQSCLLALCSWFLWPHAWCQAAFWALWLLAHRSAGARAPPFCCKAFPIQLVGSHWDGEFSRLPDPLLVISEHQVVSRGRTAGSTAGTVLQQFESQFSFMFSLLYSLWSCVPILVIVCLSSVG